jgi:hypothetical protein
MERKGATTTIITTLKQNESIMTLSKLKMGITLSRVSFTQGALCRATLILRVLIQLQRLR